MAEGTNTRIESELEVKSYIQNLKFALNNGAKIDFQAKRLVDEKRDEKYTNQYTVNKLFPDENPVDALKKGIINAVCGRLYADGQGCKISEKKRNA